MSQLVRPLVLWTAIVVAAGVVGGYCGKTNRAEGSLDQRLPDMPAAIYVSTSTQLESSNRLSDVPQYTAYLPIVQKGQHPWVAWADEHPAGEPPEALYVWHLDHPAITMPAAMAKDAYRIIQCESRHDERALNKSSGTAGLFQLHPIHKIRAERMGFSWDRMLEAQPNTDVAASIWGEQGWRPWQCKP